MNAQTLPQALAEYLDEDRVLWSNPLPATFPEGTPAARWRGAQRRQRALMLARHAGRCANYTLVAAAMLAVLYAAAQIFAAFHSGRVRRTLDEQRHHMRITCARIGDPVRKAECAIAAQQEARQ